MQNCSIVGYIDEIEPTVERSAGTGRMYITQHFWLKWTPDNNRTILRTRFEASASLIGLLPGLDLSLPVVVTFDPVTLTYIKQNGEMGSSNVFKAFRAENAQAKI